MKKLFIIALFISQMLGAQSNIEVDLRLLSKFSTEELKTWDAEKLKFETYLLDNSYFITILVDEKSNSSNINGAKRIENLEQINVYDLNISFKEDEYQYYKILGTDKVLCVKPMFLIKEEYNKINSGK